MASSKHNRIRINPADFGASEWEEMYNATDGAETPFPFCGEESHHRATSFSASREDVHKAIEMCNARAAEVQDIHDDLSWASDIARAAETLGEYLR